MLIPVQAPAEKTSGPVAQHGYVARSNAKEHTTDNRGVVNPDDVQSTEFKSLRAHHKPHLQLHTHFSKRRLQQLIRTRIKLGNTIPLQYPRNCSNVEVRRLKTGIQPLRIQRKRDRCTRLRPKSKRSSHSLLQTVLEEIDIHLPNSISPIPRRRHFLRNKILQQYPEQQDKPPNRFYRILRHDRNQEMETISTRCLDHVTQPHLHQRGIDRASNLHRILKLSRRIRIKINQHQIMPICSRSRREKLVNLQTRHVRQPDQRRLVITDNMSDRLVETMRPHLSNLNPARMIGPVLLDERFSRKPVREPVQHQWPILDERNHPICHAGIILDHISLRYSLSLPHRLVKIGEDNLPAINLDNVHRLLQRNPSPGQTSSNTLIRVD